MNTLIQYEFIKNAFLTGTIISIVAGVLGYFIVIRSQAFAAHALSHIGFAGATGAVVFGISSLLGMIGAILVAALGIGVLGERLKGRDVEIGMVLAFALGLGVFFLHIYTNSASETVSLLFGSVLSITNEDTQISLYAGILIIFLIGILFRPLLFASIDPEVALSRGVPVRFLSIIFMIILAITVAVSVQVVGILLIFALLIAPAATAIHITHKPLETIILSVILSLIFTWGGLILAFITPLPVSFYIAVISTIAYFMAVESSHFVSPHKFIASKHPTREHLQP